MGVVYNITFVIAHDRKALFLEWLRGEAVAALFGEAGGAVNPRIHTVVEAGGEKPGPEHGLSIALQAEFESEEVAHRWNDEVLPSVLAGFNRKFGPNALFFTTLLEVIPL